MKFTRLLKISDIWTFINVISGLLSIFLAIMGNLHIAAILLLTAVFFDYLDGKSAKKKHIANEFGKELDSLADIISFGVAPCVFVFFLFKDIRFILIYILYLLAGVTRLARFNILKTEGYFKGMPITINGFMIPLLYFVGSVPFVYYIYFTLAAFLMVSSIKFRKL
jgi:CDP-diacylglycerol--serine O-phosphatidyltransferase